MYRSNMYKKKYRLDSHIKRVHIFHVMVLLVVQELALVLVVQELVLVVMSCVVFVVAHPPTQRSLLGTVRIYRQDLYLSTNLHRSVQCW